MKGRKVNLMTNKDYRFWAYFSLFIFAISFYLYSIDVSKFTIPIQFMFALFGFCQGFSLCAYFYFMGCYIDEKEKIEANKKDCL